MNWRNCQRFDAKAASGHPERLSRTFVAVSLCFLSLILFSGPAAQSASQSSARSMAMAGAFTGLAEGVEAARYNPANLGLGKGIGLDIEIIGAGVRLDNNAFTLDDYNKYTGALLSTSDKRYLLGQIPQEGLDLNADVAASALSVAKGRFALTFTGIGSADVSLSRDIFDLILNGNTFADSIDISGSFSEVISYASMGLSYGFNLYKHRESQLSGGVTVNYLRGIGVQRVVELRGIATTFATGFAGDGELVAQTATGGSGYGIDLGLAFQLNQDYRIGARVSNILSNISWNQGAKEHGYLFTLDTLTIGNSSTDAFVSTEYTNDLSGFSTSLPPLLNLGIANISGKFVWGFDWEQGFRRKFGVSTKPRIGAGAEYTLAGFLPLRAGYSVGGNRNASLSLGSGLKFGGFHIDYAAVTGSSLSSGSSRGVNVAFSAGLQF